ncbi:MAG: dephospho-CoA kinase [Planctomycetota bacterium]
MCKARAVAADTDGSRRGGRAVPIIGVVGGIGSGKSAVARAFAEVGCLVSDSDAATRAVLESPDAKALFVEWWGPAVIADDGTADRAAIAKIVFADAAERKRLESVTHPAARRDREAVIRRAEAEGAAGVVSGVVVDAPLLFEAGLDAGCDLVVFVDVPRAVRVRRVAGRGWDAAELDRREAAQMSLGEKRERADVVIDNSGPLERLGPAVVAALGEARRRWAARAGDPRAGR